MTERRIEKLIQKTERGLRVNAFLGAYLFGAASVAVIPFTVALHAGAGGWLVTALGGIITYISWNEGKVMAHQLENKRAKLVWRELVRTEIWGAHRSDSLHELIEQISEVYEHDTQGEVLPLSQAVRLTFIWKQQQERLLVVEHRTQQLINLRTTLLEKQKSLNDLGDDNAALAPTLARLNEDIGPLVQSNKALRASCARLEALIGSVEASARRRELHREIGQLAAQIPIGKTALPALGSKDEHLDLERQIGREIETYLQLERDTDAHLREM